MPVCLPRRRQFITLCLCLEGNLGCRSAAHPFVAVGALDLFVDERVKYCGKLLGAGVPTELIVYPGCFHGFQMATQAQVTLRSRRDSLNALKKALL
ncbi:alpha/beta hydrolase fold domain-containing protein [Croceicoccus sp. F390]|uniref:Alpha/beta hydrolase fold domain-containing protein n=1 Tax=Croceicoccus esteveae TaxID=3075597 RepID=A0ABU2ZI40_9SPHN|nr:alpha/beta hydrolase fold domain-containing protein [Croceicoccus sp. F390]MDT0576264.1 alpha/beta hydrolase fold domain-containing protein [Croceicoccus sp. F390]